MGDNPAPRKDFILAEGGLCRRHVKNDPLTALES
jgi:hypothetical protein